MPDDNLINIKRQQFGDNPPERMTPTELREFIIRMRSSLQMDNDEYRHFLDKMNEVNPVFYEILKDVK